jgi:hypothetical protein
MSIEFAMPRNMRRICDTRIGIRLKQA